MTRFDSLLGPAHDPVDMLAARRELAERVSASAIAELDDDEVLVQLCELDDAAQARARLDRADEVIARPSVDRLFERAISLRSLAA